MGVGGFGFGFGWVVVGVAKDRKPRSCFEGLPVLKEARGMGE